MAILIVSEYDDYSTDLVIDWILHFKKEPLRLTFEDFIKKFNISKTITTESLHLTVYMDNSKVNIESIWFRMDTSNDFNNSLLYSNITNSNYFHIKKYILNEIVSAKHIFFNEKKIRCLSNYQSISLNKFNVLMKAKELRFLVPYSIVTNNRKDVLKFIKDNKIRSLICKSIGENLTISPDLIESLYQPIFTINPDEAKQIPDYFFPTLFQNQISKKYDVRVFYLNGKCYSTSIHSSLLDYRENYEELMYNPIKLPISLQLKITKLMKSLSLNIGSLDFVKDSINNKLVFLEVNPNGQFGVFSNHCNYSLEKKIAKYLCYGDK